MKRYIDSRRSLLGVVALLGALVSACGGDSGGTTPTPTPVTYAISGSVSGAVMSGVTITLSGRGYGGCSVVTMTSSIIQARSAMTTSGTHFLSIPTTIGSHDSPSLPSDIGLAQWEIPPYGDSETRDCTWRLHRPTLPPLSAYA
jgi:hypothetical protein